MQLACSPSDDYTEDCRSDIHTQARYYTSAAGPPQPPTSHSPHSGGQHVWHGAYRGPKDGRCRVWKALGARQLLHTGWTHTGIASDLQHTGSGNIQHTCNSRVSNSNNRVI